MSRELSRKQSPHRLTPIGSVKRHVMMSAVARALRYVYVGDYTQNTPAIY